MAHFPVSSTDLSELLFEDLKSFQELDFEQNWNQSVNLSDEENSLFPNTEAMNSTVFEHNPLLSSATINDGFDIENMDLIFQDELGTTDIDLPIKHEENETVMPSPTRNVQDILSIHSYSQMDNKPQIEELEEAQKKPVIRRVKASKVTKKSKRQIKPVKRFAAIDSSDDEMSDNDDKPKTKRSQKQKLYEMAPFEDPDMERCRLNAINAKMNRDKKKKEKNVLQSEMSKLQAENQELKKKNRKYRKQLSSFEARLSILESIIRAHPGLEESVKASGNNAIIKLDAPSFTSGSDTESDENIIYY